MRKYDGGETKSTINRLLLANWQSSLWSRDFARRNLLSSLREVHTYTFKTGVCFYIYIHLYIFVLKVLPT